jgi:ATP-dependent helicase HrpB
VWDISPRVSDRLPIETVLPELITTLGAHHTAILVAPPGAGKSTLAPLALLDAPWLRGNNQRIVMLEPRRIAARSIAARMAQLNGDAVGQTVGYRVRFDNRVGPATRLEVLTEGVLTRRLQSDPALEGIGLVIFDEFHERSLHADLALALCRDAQTGLREDLRILVMSATLDTEALSAALSSTPGSAPTAVPIVRAEGRKFPIDLRYLSRDPGGPIDRALVDAASHALTHESGDVLAFLPGLAEIQRAANMLRDMHPEALIVELHGDLPLEAQQRALLPDRQGRRKLVLATSIAETSLTIEGVRIVIDSGLARVPRFDPNSAMTRLETVRVTRDSADQRAGRAGRLGPGVCFRLWTELTQSQLTPIRRPEIIDADLAPLRAELAQWGISDAYGLSWVTPPPQGSVRQAEQLLRQLHVLDDANRITRRGADVNALPTHPRIAHLLIEGRALGLGALAADVAALLDERDPLPRGSASGSDLSIRVDALRRWRAQKRAGDADPGVLSRVERIAAQWRDALSVRADNTPADPLDIGRLIALAYPDRIGQRRDNASLRYKLSGGRGVQLLEHDPLARERWIAVANADAGKDDGRVYLAAPLAEAELTGLATQTDVLSWDARQGVLLAQRESRIGELVLSAKPLNNPPDDKRLEVLYGVVSSEGVGLLHWTDTARQYQARLLSLRAWRGDEWPDVSDAALIVSASEWLTPYAARINRRSDFERIQAHDVLTAALPYTLQRQLDALAPTHLEVPSGSHVRLEYKSDGAAPVLAVKIQEMFGLADTPAVNDGRTRVLVHLLTPAQRPIQVTQDLRNFWNTTYPSVRKELRGRYPKHPWPEDPWNAPATKRTIRRSG